MQSMELGLPASSSCPALCRASTSYLRLTQERRGWPGKASGSDAVLRTAMPGHDENANRFQGHNSRALENANDDTRLVFSSRIKVRVIGGSARWLQFSRSQSRQLTPIGVPSAFSRSMPVA